jgi:hypothetical protein
MTTTTAQTMAEKILFALTKYGALPTRTLTFTFGRIEFAVAIKQLHRDGKVQKHRDGWKLAD